MSLYEGTSRERRLSLARLKESATKADDGEVIWELAAAYEDGVVDNKGVVLLEKNPKRAAELYYRGVKLGNVGCMVNLANLLARGRGVRRDIRAALRLEILAARKGDPGGAFNAGISYKKLRDFRKSLRWFRQAEVMGNDSARLEIAKAQLYGLGTKRNVREAIGNLKAVVDARRCSAGESEEACLLLAYLYIDGWLVPRAHRRSIQWLTEAQKKGSTIASAAIRDPPMAI